ncbi:hypothetical protein BDN70DRAFT_895231 [Pholiota conissans]|uniref:Uncharacterized protein n=1 Tax=Pholiota conissans TaxID=109636 RepID=A0A9P6D0X9_9AGAR|nr:hypothetical protein BDN70DRAFT_895231 [Pholiota conissans]
MTSMAPTEAPVAAQQLQYKGKYTHRSWPDLPEEIIRHIATFYIYDLAVNNYCPQSWEARKHWYSRMAYASIRDTIELEKYLMSVCPQWKKAILHIIDPNDQLLHHSVIQPIPQLNASSNNLQAPLVLTAYQHLKNIFKCSCVICRINHPLTSLGLAAAKTIGPTPYFGYIPLCKEHDKNRTTYCGLCLRDSAMPTRPDSAAREYELQQTLGIVENEDEDTWPGIEMTCRKCRSEWLWRRASPSLRDREAVGGPSFQCQDWEARQNIDNFLELAEGNIADVLILAREKHWLRMNTNYADLGSQLLASQKNEQRYNINQNEEEEDSEEDRDAAFMAGSAQVREMSLGHWARRRILDGHWLSPADIWYNNRVLGQPLVASTVHPCPWARDFDNEDPDTAEAQQHPSKETLTAEVPPSYQLCEQAFLQHIKSMREVLGPPMRNLVRKIVMECQVPTAKGFADPAQVARKMTLEDVIRILREEEGVWYDGVDWVERRRNQEEEDTTRRQAKEDAALLAAAEDRSRLKEDDLDSTTSSSSSSAKSSSHAPSNSTSPVLSTSTLQTTPSPPPLSDEGAESTKNEKLAPERQEKMLASRPRLIPFDPVKSPPRLLGTIPYIPVTIAHLPNYSLDAIKSAWRDACAPLYHCSCSICERAKVADMNARAAAYAANAPVPIVPSQPVQAVLRTTIYPNAAVRHSPGVDTAEIELKEVSEVDLDGDGEEEIDDYEASDLEYTSEDDEEEDAPYDARGDYRYSPSPERELVPQRPRKRSSDELEEPLADEVDDRRSDASSRRHVGTPPKRARLGDRPPLATNSDEEEVADAPESLQPPLEIHASPTRLRKRSSEELDEDQAREPHTPHKRVRVARSDGLGRYDGDAEDNSRSPVSLRGRRTHEEVEDTPYIPPKVGERPRRLVSKSDMDSLIALDDVDE